LPNNKNQNYHSYHWHVDCILLYNLCKERKTMNLFNFIWIYPDETNYELALKKIQECHGFLYLHYGDLKLNYDPIQGSSVCIQTRWINLQEFFVLKDKYNVEKFFTGILLSLTMPRDVFKHLLWYKGKIHEFYLNGLYYKLN